MDDLSNTRILCVDDNPELLSLYQDILVDEEATFIADVLHRRPQDNMPKGNEPVCQSNLKNTNHIILAPSGEKAVELVQREQQNGGRFAVGFFDMVMPGGIDGLETIRRILKIEPNIHCAVVTAQTDLNLTILNTLFPSRDQWLFLNKPFGVMELKQIARHLMSAWHLKQLTGQYTEQLEAEVEKKALKHRRVAERLMMISQFSRELSIAADLSQLLDQLLEQIRLLINAKIGSILLLDDDQNLVVKAAAGPDREKVLGLRNKLSNHRISGHTLTGQQPILIRDLRTDPRFSHSSEQMRLACNSLISVPLLVKGKPIGVINFGSPGDDAAFAQEECTLVCTLAGQIAMSIENARLYREVKNSYEQLGHSYLHTVKALTKAIDAKDHYTFGHSNRVAHYSGVLARELGYSPKDLERLDLACFLHDVGKIGITETILNKPGRLIKEEFEAIKTHPAKGAEIIGEIPYLEDIREIVLHHHERADGKGYPGCMGGQEIPLGARIIAVADTYDAMTSDRPYRRGMDRNTVHDEIQRCAGTQFDPAMVDAFTAAFKKGLL